MARRETEEIAKHHIYLYKRDWDRLVEYYGGNVGVSRAIRVWIRLSLNYLDAKKEQHAKSIGPIELPITVDEPIDEATNSGVKS